MLIVVNQITAPKSVFSKSGVSVIHHGDLKSCKVLDNRCFVKY